MRNITIKKGEININKAEPTTATPEKTIDNNLELQKFSVEVESRIKDNITSDFTLASLDPLDKELVIEITETSYFVQNLIKNITNNYRAWRWHKETTKDGKIQYVAKNSGPTEHEIRAIERYAEMIFDSAMVRIYMIVIMNRNKPVVQNPLLGGLLQRPDPHPMTQDQQMQELVKESKGITGWLKKKFGKQQQEEMHM